MEKIKRLHPQIRENIRYKLGQKMMNELMLTWFTQEQTKAIIKKLIEDCKATVTTLSAPNPLFAVQLRNSLTNSQMASNHFIPPINPNSLISNNQIEKRNSMQSSQSNESRKNINESLSNSMMTSMKLSKIPKFYFPTVSNEIIQQENDQFLKIFNNKNYITLNDFLPITKDIYNFPGNYNKVLFNKIDTEHKGKITRDEFIKFHIQNFRGNSYIKCFFNFIKNPNRNYIVKTDFIPFLQQLLETNPSLDFLKEHPIYQKKYTDSVITRIFYTDDINDDGKITLHDFRRSKLVEALKRAAEEDINNIRDYFSYEHFWVMYYIFSELDSQNERNIDRDLYINKEVFSKYDGHSLGKKAVDRIFEQIPRKFVSEKKDYMSFEDFTWYLLSEEDKTNRTSITYWFKLIDLDSNGIITPSEMEYFYQEQEQRLEMNQSEVIYFKDILCQVNDMIPPDKKYQWTLQNFLAHPKESSVVFNILLNLNKFIINEQKDPFSLTEIEKRTDYSDWDKFAFVVYAEKAKPEDDEEDEIDDQQVIDEPE